MKIGSSVKFGLLMATLAGSAVFAMTLGPPFIPSSKPSGLDGRLFSSVDAAPQPTIAITNGPSLITNQCADMSYATYYRINPTSQAGLLTTWSTESSGAMRYGFTLDKGILFNAARSAAPGLVAVHRLYNSGTNDFLWLHRGDEIAAAKAAGYSDQFVDFYASPSYRGCTAPVYRLTKEDKNRYASAPGELETLMGQKWKSQGVAFYGARTQDPAASPFLHPGIGLGWDRIEFLQNMVKSGKQPWKSEYDFMVERVATRDSSGKLSFKATPYATVGCSYSDGGDSRNGCWYERLDARVAYEFTLLYVLSGNPEFGAKAMDIMNAWSSRLQSHYFPSASGGTTQTRLNASWAAQDFARAAELIRATYSVRAGVANGWADAEIARMQRMLVSGYLPYINTAHPGGGANLVLSMADASIGIGVFADRRDVFDAGVEMWRKQLKAHIYLQSDGVLPVPHPAWPYGSANTRAFLTFFHTNQLQNGMAQETCRDMSHATMSISDISITGETARLQGVDLFEENEERIRAMAEYTAKLMADRLEGKPLPANLCRASNYENPNTVQTYLADGGISYALSWRAIYLHYGLRRNLPMPQVQRLLSKPQMSHPYYRSDLFSVFERLTHGADALQTTSEQSKTH